MAESKDSTVGRAVKLVVWAVALLEAGFMGFALWRHWHGGGR